MKQRVVVYDPDPVNPYGRETTRVLATQYDVTAYLSRAADWCPWGVRVPSQLAGHRASDGLVRTAWLRVAGPLAATVRAMRGRSPLIVLWSRHFWDSLIFALATRLSVPIVVVVHNPVVGRRRKGLSGMCDRLLERWAGAIVLHGTGLAHGAHIAGPRVSVVPHPSYKGWLERFGRPWQPRTGERARLLFLGAMRWDKSADDVAAIIRCLRFPASLQTVGKGEIPENWLASAAASGVELTQCGGRDFASDDEVASALARADVLVAPYRAATQSGTVILSRSYGLPVVAYAAGALGDVVPPDWLVEAGDTNVAAALLEKAASVGVDGGPEFCERADAASLRGWRQVLGSLLGEKTEL